jgi:magnesium-protoporphyrin O-methyltransferase
VSRAIVTAENVLLRLRGMEFRVYTHPPEAMLAVLEDQGFRRTFTDDGLVWHVAGLERTA